MAKKMVKKVLSPIKTRETTAYLDVGLAFVQEDGSIIVNLDVLPINGKLLIPNQRTRLA